jgi:hypothetical protein
VALTRDSSLELPLHILGGSLFERIGAAACHHGERNRAQDRQGLHLLILENGQCIARELKRLSDEAMKRYSWWLPLQRFNASTF